jgi:hypothetical protein
MLTDSGTMVDWHLLNKSKTILLRALILYLNSRINAIDT